jgi:hypothetical protein
VRDLQQHKLLLELLSGASAALGLAQGCSQLSGKAAVRQEVRNMCEVFKEAGE